jgi:hypothetical protein
LRLDPAQNGARNNLAMTLLDLKCVKEAREQIAQIDVGKLEGPLVAAVRDTQKQSEAAPHGGTAERCNYQAR